MLVAGLIFLSAALGAAPGTSGPSAEELESWTKRNPAETRVKLPPPRPPLNPLDAPGPAPTATATADATRGEAALRFFRGWVDSREPEVDRDGKGKPDLWREFYSNGQLKTLRSSSRGDGKADFIVSYAKTGEVLRREYDDGDAGTAIVTFERRSGEKAEVTAYLARGAKFPNRRVTVYRAPAGYFKRRTELDLDESGKPGRVYEQVLSDEDWFIAPDLSVPCPPGVAPVLTEAQLTELVGVIGDRIQVDPGCNGFHVTGDHASYTSEQLKRQAAAAIQGGIACLRSRGAAGKRLADEVLAEAFSSSRRPLRFSCAVNGPSPCGGVKSPDFCAQAARFTDPGYPGVTMASDCGRRAADLNATLFHEVLHLAGEPGHQHLHDYSDVNDTEHVEPCAQCCQGPFAANSPRRADFCSLCDDTPARDPAQHNLKYGLLEVRQGDYWIGMHELEKAVPLDPNNLELWYGLLEAYTREINEAGDHVPDELNARLYVAMMKIRYLESHPGARSTRAPALPPGSERERQLDNEMHAGLYGIAAEEVSAWAGSAPPGGVAGVDRRIAGQILALKYHMSLARIGFGVCAGMSSATTPAPSPLEQNARACYAFQNGEVEGVAAAAEGIERARQAVVSSGADPQGVDEGTVSSARALAGRFRAGVGCVVAGTPLQECAAARSAATAARNAARPASPTCPPPSGL
jgi:hypothetical protein